MNALKDQIPSQPIFQDCPVAIEILSINDYKIGNRELVIYYDFVTTVFGDVLIANTGKGICRLVFFDSETQAIEELQQAFPHASLVNQATKVQEQALRFFLEDECEIKSIVLHLKASAFQLKVWQSLLSIPKGNIATYSAIAQKINQPKAARAVGTAIGRNPVALLIPCHRILQSSGNLGGYMWGVERKRAILAWENATIT